MKDLTINDNFLIVFILAVSFTVSLFAPNSYIERSYKSYPTGLTDFSQDANFTNIKPSNSFILYEILFERSNISKPLHEAIEYSSFVELYYSNSAKDTKTFNGIIYPITPNRQSTTTGSFRLFLSQTIQYTKNYIKIKIPRLPENIKSVTLISRLGNESFILFLICARCLFTILALIEISNLIRKKSQKESYHQLYFWLFLFSIDPLMIIHYFSPMKIFIYFDNLSQAIFDSYFRFYFISLLSNIRGSITSQLPTTFFFVVYLLTKICHYMSSSLKYVDFLTAASTQSLPFLSFELGLEMTYFTWLIVAITSSYSKAKTSYEKSAIKSIYTIILILVSIYLFKEFSNNLLADFSQPINTDYLNFILYYAVAFLIGAIGNKIFSQTKITKLLRDDEQPEPIAAVFEKTNDQV